MARNPSTRSNAPSALPPSARGICIRGSQTRATSRADEHRPKPVRSLRKSEQAPPVIATPAAPPPDSKLPIHRHSDQEIAEIRRREALAMMTPAAEPETRHRPPGAAHPRLPSAPPPEPPVSSSTEFPMAATAGCAAAAMLHRRIHLPAPPHFPPPRGFHRRDRPVRHRFRRAPLLSPTTACHVKTC